MMNTIKISALLILAASLCGCSKWTEPKSLDITPKPAAPEEGYYQDLRNYKAGEHKLSVFGMDAVEAVPTSRVQHLTAMPDSTDYIYLRSLGKGLHPTLADEISSIRELKGTKTLADVDFISICDEWDALQDRKEEAGQPAGTEAEFTALCRERLLSQLEYCSEYGLDGIMASFNGAAEFALAGRACFVNTIMEWLGDNPSKTLFVRGILATLIRNTNGNTEAYDIKSFLNRCEGLIYDCGTEYSASNIEMAIDRIIDRGNGNVPTDRFLVEVTVPTPADPAQIGMSPVAAASWMLEPYSNFSKKGLCVSNSQDAYYHAGNSYGSLRAAIGIMNRSNN